ncbi:DEKNAAC100173 [Brettanomyces naardenensis]|uniref:DEKNAAC100173 n=1 Tax=Brettanomyces naardenensis TaxID=13370 RepID=A0A448YF84_BRENA|nr:DEKNAAC100173 [Brettanomyces naardenensis]
MAPAPPATDKPLMPQALSTALSHRLKSSPNALFPSSSTARGSKRSTNRINYAEDFEYDFEEDANEDEDYIDDRGSNPYDPGYYTSQQVNLSKFQGKQAPTKRPKTVFTDFEQLSNMSRPEQNVPIRIKIDSNGISLRDLLIWNANETLVTPELFAAVTCEELELPKSVENSLASQIEDQLKTYRELLGTAIPLLQQEKEFHVTLDLAVNLGEQFYSDRIEWNLLDNLVTPEMFAENVVKDMGLSREFVNAIAFSIYEELMKVRRDLIENPQQIPQYADSLPFYNHVYQPPDADTFAMLQLQGLRHDMKKHGEEFSPKLENLTEWEIERRETEKERNLRRRKRETLRKVVSGSYGDTRNTKRWYDELEGTWKNV